MLLYIVQLFNRISLFLHRTLHRDKGLAINILTQAESLSLLLSSEKSLIRIGDGEATILEGGHIYFQRNSLSLRRRLKRLLKSYSSHSKYLLAVPGEHLVARTELAANNRKWARWEKSRFIFSQVLPQNSELPYLDAFMFREDSNLTNDEISALWKNKRNVFFVHSNFKYYADFRTRNPEKNVLFIPLFGANAYANCDEVVARIESACRNAGIVRKDAIALVSAGPAGKIIVSDLSGHEIRAFDTGHYFDFKFYDLARDWK